MLEEEEEEEEGIKGDQRQLLSSVPESEHSAILAFSCGSSVYCSKLRGVSS